MMAENQLLLKGQVANHNSRIWISLFIFKIISGFQSEMSSTNDGQYIYHFVNEQNGTTVRNNLTQSDDTCPGENTSSFPFESSAQRETTTIQQYNEMISSGLSIFVMILLGPLTDSIGRKPLLIWNVTMLLIGMAIRTIVVYNSLDVYFVLITSVFEGLSGTHYTFDLASSGIMADTTRKDHQRSFVMILYNSANNIGFFLAQIVTGYFMYYFGYITQYYICGCLLLILDILIIKFLKEQKRSKYLQNESMCTISLKSQIWSLMTDKEIGNRKFIFAWLSALTVAMFSVTAYIPIRNLYQLGSPFCWSSERIGWYGSSYTAVQGIIGPILIALLQRYLPDEIVIHVGFLSTIACFLIYGFAYRTWMLYLVVGVGVIRYSHITLIQAIISRKVHPDKQGVLFSNIALMDAIVRVAGVAALSQIYNQTRPIFKGTAFLVMAVLTLISSLMSIVFTKIYGVDPEQRKSRYYTVMEDNQRRNTIQYTIE